MFSIDTVRKNNILYLLIDIYRMIVSQNLLPSNHTAHLGQAAVPRGIHGHHFRRLGSYSSISKPLIVVMATESAKWKKNYIDTMNPIVIARARLGYHIFNPRRHYSDCDDQEWSTAAAGIGSAG